MQGRRRPGGWAAPPPLARRARLCFHASAAASNSGGCGSQKRLTILHFNDVSCSYFAADRALWMAPALQPWLASSPLLP